MKKRIMYIAVLLLTATLFTGCAQSEAKPSPLPPAEADEASDFGIDANINMDTIDSYLGREDTEYIDVRMLFDPADYAAIGGEADLTRTIEGFKVVPYPYIASLEKLPVSGAYEGQRLYSISWGETGNIISAEPNFRESELILSELFPQDKAIFLMCGGGGYSGMMKSLLIYLGWEPELIYNTGANWGYTGENSLELVIYPEDAGDDNIYATWRADYAYIDFSRLHPLEG